MSLSNLWVDWTKREGLESCANNMMTLKFTQHNIMEDMEKAGFEVPPRRRVEEALEAGMEPLPTIQAKNKIQAKAVSFAHVLNLVWAPLIEYMESCAGEKPPEWTTALSRHHAALLVEMAGTVLAADEPLDIDDWLEHKILESLRK